MRRGAKPTKAKVESEPPAARKSRGNEGSRVADLEKRLVEALEQQTATAEILRVIASSPTDIQPVFDTIARNAARLCEATHSSVNHFDGELLTLVATHGFTAQEIKIGKEAFPRRAGRESAVGRTILTRAAVHIVDVTEDPEYRFPGAKVGYRTILAVPMLREGAPIGAVAIWRRAEVRPFSDAQIALVTTFADQAVIAIENVRLFQELQTRNAELTESLEQQTATADVLKVISRSTFNLQPVLETLIENATKLCDATHGNIFRFDGEVFRVGAFSGTASPELKRFRERTELRPERGSVVGRVGLEHRMIHILDVLADPEFQQVEAQRIAGFRTVLGIPMLREGTLIGAIVMWRTEVRAFTDRQIELVTTFADQAVIAIENVRLFTELQEKNRALTEAHAQVTESLQQQTATAEILRVIASSPTDLQPVMEAVAESAARVCGATDSSIFRVDGDVLRLVTRYGGLPRLLRIGDTVPVTSDTVVGRAVAERRTLHVEDLHALPETEFPETRARQRRSSLSGSRTYLATPLLREGVPVGLILIRRWEARPFSARQIALLETFANQAVIAIENVRLFQELQERNRELTAALEREAASADLLRIIAASPTDLTPVFESILDRALILCGATVGGVLRYDGGLISLATAKGPSEVVAAVGATYPRRLDDSGLTVRSIRERRTVHVADTLADPSSLIATRSIRGQLSVPMLKDGKALGAIVVTRPEPGLFSDGQVKILETFADQAVIAIENVRLFTELQGKNRALTEAHTQVTEALEQQTATAEILRVISRSPTDVQPVFEAIAESAARLTGALYGGTLLVSDGVLQLGAVHAPGGEDVDAFRRMYPIPLDDNTLGTPVIRNGLVVNIPDTATEPTLPEPQRRRAVTLGARSLLMVPMLHDPQAVGLIFVARRDSGVFTDKQVTLLQTFAAQAVIAIENVRLFTELEARNRELTESLEQQTATADVLKLISRSTFDVQPVLETLIESAVRLCGAEHGHIYRFDGELLQRAAGYGSSPEHVELRRRHPVRLWRGSIAGRAALERRVVHVADVLADSEYGELEAQRLLSLRTGLGVPLLKEDVLIGVFAIWRTEVRPFTDKQIGLVTTFADQAVIAIENVRLLQELQARTRELGRSVEELKALGDVGQAVSSTLDLESVLATIVSRAVMLSDSYSGIVYEFDEGTQSFHARATHQISLEHLETLRATPIRLGEGAVGRAAFTRQPVEVADIEHGQLVAPQTRGLLAREGMGSLVAVPLVREDRLFGGLVIVRRERGAFSPEVVATLQTLASQSVLAIQNARLFREIADKSRQLEAASRHKSEFLANMSHELRTPAERDHRLLGGPGRADVRGGEREAGRVPAGHPVLGPAPALTDQRHPGPVQGGGRPARAGTGAVPSADRPGQCADPGPGAGDPARDHTHRACRPRRGRRRRGRAEGEAGPVEPSFQCREVHPGGGTGRPHRHGGRGGHHHRRQRHGDRDCARGPGGHLRGVPPGRPRRRPQARGHGARADAGQEVRGAARGADLGPEPGGPGVHVQLHAARPV